MNTKELKIKSVDELNTELLELRKEQFNLRMQKGVGESPKPYLHKRVRRDIARVKTILKEKEREV